MNLVEGLRKARHHLEGGWCPFLCRDAHGRMTTHDNEDAKKWPILDALWLAFGSDVDGILAAEELLQTFATMGVEPRPTLSRWEETPGRTQQEILNVFGRAILRAIALQRRSAA